MDLVDHEEHLHTGIMTKNINGVIFNYIFYLEHA